MSLPWLKEQTNGIHRKLESLLGQHLFNPDLTSQRYAEILSVFYSNYQIIEYEVGQVPSIRPLLNDRSKVEMIENDLKNLEVSETVINQNIFKSHNLSIPNHASALGAMYVMEGATLGGNHIQKRLSQLTWMKDEYLNFFISYGNERGQMWNAFIKNLADYSEKNPESDKQIGDAASMTFKFMHESFLNLEPCNTKKQH